MWFEQATSILQHVFQNRKNLWPMTICMGFSWVWILIPTPVEKPTENPWVSHTPAEHCLELNDILYSCGFSWSYFYHVLKLWCETGDMIKPSTKLCSWPCILDHDDLNIYCVLFMIIWIIPSMRLCISSKPTDSSLCITSPSTLKCTDISHKKLKQIAAKRNEAHHAAFVARMAQYMPKQLGFLDKTSKDERTRGWWYGWSKKGWRAETKQVFVHSRCVSTKVCHGYTMGLVYFWTDHFIALSCAIKMSPWSCQMDKYWPSYGQNLDIIQEYIWKVWQNSGVFGVHQPLYIPHFVH